MIYIVNVNREPAGSGESGEARAFAAHGAAYACAQCKTDDEIVAAAGDAQVILFTAAYFTEALLARLPRLRLLVRYGVGYDRVDLTAARARGVDVCNAPAYGSYDVAEHAFALLMAVNRKLAAYDRHIREGKWGQSADYVPSRLEGKTLGLLGFGRIARQTARFAHGFGMTTLACDPYLPAADIAAAGSRAVDLDELLRESDFISLHAPLTPRTRGVMDAAAFGNMKPSAVLINTSRGELVNEADLLAALRDGHIRGAGLDVFADAPRAAGHPFHALDNLVMTPHVAWHSAESVVALRDEVIAEVVRFLTGQPPLNVVNRESGNEMELKQEVQR